MKTILIVEDNEMNLELTRQILEDHYAILEANNGEEAVRIAAAKLPDLILMDLSLPKVDGWEACRRIKANKETAKIPVIALTAHAVKGDYEEALEAGCDSYLTKPVDEALLLDEVRQWVGVES